jgi:hypothetical protein
MTYQIGDRVQLVAELGGAIGYVTELRGGPQGEGSVQVSQPWGQSRVDDGMVAPPGQVAAGPLPLPTAFEVGQVVTLAGDGGVIVGIAAGDVAEVEVEVPLTRRRWARRGRGVPMGAVVVTRTHFVPLWRLAMEN